MRHRRGFTLIELAIVLVLIGLLVGMGAGLIGLLVKRVHYNQTRERLDANVEALIGGFRGCIPATDNASTAFGYCNLSVLRNRTDAWREDFLCLVADEIANYNSYCDACARRTTSLKVVDEMDNNATHENIAFVLISKGPDHRLQTDIGNDTVEIHVPGRAYDDLVRYVTLNELKAKLKCEYAEERLRILNNELPYGFVGSSYNATVYAEGGVPFPGGIYEWCVNGSSYLNSANLTVTCNASLDDYSSPCGNCSHVNISGIPNGTDTFTLTFMVRDQDNNTTSKTLSLTINPPTNFQLGNGTRYEVYNQSGEDLYWGCECQDSCKWQNNTFWPDKLGPGECVEIFVRGRGDEGPGKRPDKGPGKQKCLQVATICYSDAVEADNNTDQKVKLTDQYDLQDY